MPVQEPKFLDDGSAATGAHWELLQRIISSSQLKRASRMREFLLFVGRRTLQDGCDQIHEQEIGCEVFGRPPLYDTSVDNIVRVNATDLRKRIEAYFESEGFEEPIILEIPRGSYKPIFRPRLTETRSVETGSGFSARQATSMQISITDAPAEEPLTAMDSAPQDAVQSPIPVKPTLIWLPAHLVLIAAGVLIVSLAAGFGTLWVENRTMRHSLYAWQSNPALSSFWSDVLMARPDTDVVLADTSFALIEDITKRPIPLNDYLNRKYVSQIHSETLSPDRREDIDLILARNYGSVGDFRVAQRIAALDPLGHSIHVRYALEYTAGLLKQDNVILIGGRKSNPWVDIFGPRINFAVEYDPNTQVSFVKNLHPAPGEEAIYSTADDSAGYSLVAYLPSANHQGKVLIIAGTGSEATEGAGEFITSEDQLQRFRNLLHVEKLPYFEVLLRTKHLSATPLDATIIAYRTYPS